MHLGRLGNLFLSLLYLSRAKWTCPAGQCFERTQKEWTASAFACLPRPAEEFKVRLVPYRDKYYLDRFKNCKESMFPLCIGGTLFPANFSDTDSFAEGIVQTYRLGAWRPVCVGPGFNSERYNYDQTCRQLGYRYGVVLVSNNDMHKELCALSEPGVRIGKCRAGEKIGQCTKQFNQNVVAGGCSFPDVNSDYDCHGEVAIRCSNYRCLESNVGRYFSAAPWQSSTWISNATHLFGWQRLDDGTHSQGAAPQQLCECIEACLTVGASACGANCFGCYAGTSLIAADSTFACWDGVTNYQKAVSISPVDAAKNWSLPASVPNATVDLPSPCLRSSLAVRFYGSALYSMNQEDGPLRYTLQGFLDCLFLNQAIITLTNTSIEECEWRVEFFFATENITAQTQVLQLLERFATDGSQVYGELPSCIDKMSEQTTSTDMKFAFTIFKALVTSENPLLEFVFDERWPDRPCTTSTSTTGIMTTSTTGIDDANAIQTVASSSSTIESQTDGTSWVIIGWLPLACMLLISSMLCV